MVDKMLVLHNDLSLCAARFPVHRTCDKYDAPLFIYAAITISLVFSFARRQGSDYNVLSLVTFT